MDGAAGHRVRRGVARRGHRRRAGAAGPGRRGGRPRRRSRRGRPAAGRAGCRRPPTCTDAAGRDLDPTSSPTSRRRSARPSPRRGRAAASCSASPSTQLTRPTWAPPPGCGCATTSRPARWSSTPSPPDRTPLGLGRRAPPGTSPTSTPPALDAELAQRLGLGRADGRAAGRAVRDAAAADRRRRPDDLPATGRPAARDAAEGRTVFSRPGGGTRVGEKLTDLPLTLRSDPARTRPGVARRSSIAARLERRRVGLRQRPAARADRLGAATACSAALMHDPALRRADRAAGDAAGVDNLSCDGGGERLAGRDGRGHRARPAADLPVVHPRGRPGRPCCSPGLTRDGVYLVEGGEVDRCGEQLPVQRDRRSTCWAGPPRRAAPSGRCRASGATTSPGPRCRRCGSPTST